MHKRGQGSWAQGGKLQRGHVIDVYTAITGRFQAVVQFSLPLWGDSNLQHYVSPPRDNAGIAVLFPLLLPIQYTPNLGRALNTLSTCME